MPKKEDKTPKHIKEFKEKHEAIEGVLTTTGMEYSRGYLSAADTHLFDEKTKTFDHKRLKDEKVRKAFKDSIREHLTEKAMEYFNSKSKDPVVKARLLRDYSGITKEQIDRLVDTHQEKYDITKHESVRNTFMREVEKRVLPIASEGLDDTHIDDLLGEMPSAKGLVDSKQMRIGDALALYDIHKEHGILTHKIIKESYRAKEEPEPAYLIEPKAP